MPEGHTIHRLARDLTADLAGTRVQARSPQGRFEDGARRLDGATLDAATAWGKHLFCTFDTADVLHIHLGLIGKLRRRGTEIPPGDTVRLEITTDGLDHSWNLTGPQTCAVIDPAAQDRVTEGLGPDPLRRGRGRRDAFIENLARTRRPIGATLLDQSVVAGIGNVYRAELLWIIGVHPQTPSSRLDPSVTAELWDHTVDQLRRGLKWNRIVTVSEADVGKRVTSRIAREDSLAVYKRGGLPCRRCATEIEELSVAGRTIALCPQCQPRPESA